MRNHLGKIVLIGIVFAAGYLVFNMENVSGYTIPFISVSRKDAAQIGSQALSKVKQITKETFSTKASELTNALAKKAESLTQDALTAVKAEVVSLMKGAVKGKVDSLAADLGIGAQQSAGPISNTISPSTKSGTPAYFTIKNNEQGVIDYAIDWKDGKSENGQIVKGESKIVSHSWDKAGEYILQFKITSSGGSNEYQVGISIL